MIWYTCFSQIGIDSIGGNASVERAFSVINFVKNKLRNRMSDDLLDDCLVTFIERDVLLNVKEKRYYRFFYGHET
jgi:hypothetical protein